MQNSEVGETDFTGRTDFIAVWYSPINNDIYFNNRFRIQGNVARVSRIRGSKCNKYFCINFSETLAGSLKRHMARSMGTVRQT
jgi:hypothetical protein